MKNQYLVIKLPGNWIEQEQTRKRVKVFLGVDVLDERSVVTYSGTQDILRERRRCDKGCVDYVKSQIAYSLGKRLLSDGRIRFSENTKDSYTVSITGEITIINEEPEGGAE